MTLKRSAQHAASIRAMAFHNPIPVSPATGPAQLPLIDLSTQAAVTGDRARCDNHGSQRRERSSLTGDATNRFTHRTLR